MQFQPKTEVEIALENCWPAAEYDFEVISAIDTVSKKSGKPMIKVELRVFSGGSERKVTDYLMESMAFKLIHFARSTGMSKEYEAGGLDPMAMQGRSGRVKLKIKEQSGYMPKNEVQDYIASDKKIDAGDVAPAQKLNPQQLAKADTTDVPF